MSDLPDRLPRDLRLIADKLVEDKYPRTAKFMREAADRIDELEVAIGTHRDVVLNQSEYDPTSDDVTLWAALEGVSDE